MGLKGCYLNNKFREKLTNIEWKYQFKSRNYCKSTYAYTHFNSISFNTSHEMKHSVEMSLFQQEKAKKEKKFNEVKKEEDCYTNMRQTIAVYLED